MKLTKMPLAIAVAVGLASTSAHAALGTPTIGTSSPSLTTLYVSIWDTQTHNSELVNLSYQYSDLTATGALGPDSAGAPYTTATNPATGTGSVLQLNFGVLPGFSSTFGSPGATTDYMVLGANAQAGALFTESSAAQAGQLTSASLTTLAGGINGQLSNWETNPAVSGSGTAIDTTGAANYNALIGPNNGGNNGLSGFNFSGTVGSALDFFNLVPGSKRGTVALTQYGNTQGAGFWFLSSSGDLTYNVSAVPLPAAVWLLVSGLAGLGAIGRRRAAA